MGLGIGAVSVFRFASGFSLGIETPSLPATLAESRFLGVQPLSHCWALGPEPSFVSQWFLGPLTDYAGLKRAESDDPLATVPIASLDLSTPFIQKQWRGLERQIDRLIDRFGRVEATLPAEVRETYQAEFDELIGRLSFWEKEQDRASTLPEEDRARYEGDICIGQSLLGDRLIRFAALVFSEPLPDAHRAPRGLRRRLLSRSRSAMEAPPSPRPQSAGLVEALVNHDIGYGASLELRYHQEEALSAIKGWMASQQDARTCGLADPRFLETTVVMPVGGGKTRLMAAAFAAAVQEKVFRIGDKMIVVNHTDQIHGQNLDVLERLRPYFRKKTGRELKITAYKAETKDVSGDVIVVSVPTVNNEEKRRIFKGELRKALGVGGRIAMTAIDEVHHLEMGKSSGREMWEELLKTLREVDGSFFQIGFTATPTGKEGRVIYRLREQELMQTGVTPRTYLVRVEGVDLTQLKVSAATGDFDQRELTSTLLAHPKRNERLYRVLEQRGMRRTDPSPGGRLGFEAVLGFGADLQHARSMAEDYQRHFGSTIRLLGQDKGKISKMDLELALEDYRIGKTDAVIVVVAGNTSVRKEILEAVTRGEIEAVFTVDALVEGADLHMFRHQLGARPTFSRIKKGQERGRINRRSPDEVTSQGELKSDSPRILFDVIDRYHSHEKSLVRYGDVMGIRHAGMAYGDLLDAMRGEASNLVDREGKSVQHRGPEEVSPSPDRPLPENDSPDSEDAPQNAMTAMLRDLLASRYQNDAVLLAIDLGESEEFVEGLLKGEGWVRGQWFLRRLATLSYQEREVFVEAWNRALGREESDPKRGRIDRDRMLTILEAVLREAEEKGERLTPNSAVARTHARYAQGLSEGEVGSSLSGLRRVISLNERLANPRAREILEASPVIEAHEQISIDIDRLLVCLEAVLRAAEEKGETLAPRAAADQTHARYCQGIPEGEVGPSRKRFWTLVSLYGKLANPRVREILQASPVIEAKEKIDTDRLLVCLEAVLKEAGEKGEILAPRSAADRTYASYGQGLPEGEVGPSQTTFWKLISLNEKSANPRAREILQASPVIEVREKIDTDRMLTSLEAVLREAEKKGERLNLSSAAARTHERYRQGLPVGAVGPSQTTFRILISLNEKFANPGAREILEASPVIQRQGRSGAK